MSKNVAILMATYNGEKYITKQIESIISQSFKNWKLYIRDDGSSDNTIEIIKNFQKEDDRICLVNDSQKYHGAFINFHYLIDFVRKQEKFDYYFFCDQDDIWKPEKIHISLQNFTDDSRIQMVYSDMTIINEEGAIKEDSFSKNNNLLIRNNKLLFFAFNTYVWGCTVAFNRLLLENIPEVIIDENPKIIKFFSHDKFFAEFANYYGDLIFIDKPLIYYRRHNENTTEITSGKVNKNDFINFFKKGVKDKFKVHATCYNQTLFFMELVRKNGIQNEELLSLENSVRNGGLKALVFLWKNNIHKDYLSQDILLKFILLVKGYKKYLLL